MPADIARPLGALILAAGFGRRFGADKRRYRLPDGRVLLLATVARYLDVFQNVQVVVRREDDELERLLEAEHPSVATVVAADAALGMGHSLAAGITAVAERWDSVCIALGDMPFIEATTLQLLLTRFEEAAAQTTHTILQPLFEGQGGHPVFFTAHYFSELMNLEGDAGARAVIAANAGELVQVKVADEGVLKDVDRPL